MTPRLIIHGGAGRALRDPGRAAQIRASLYRILDETYALLAGGASATEAVVAGCKLLEDDPNFNAGTGSVLQSDGQIRMSAGLMDGGAQRFSGVVNVSRVRNPIALANHLQGSADRVVSDFGALELARELALPVYDPRVERRVDEWLEARRAPQARVEGQAAEVVSAKIPPSRPDAVAPERGGARDEEDGRGTIGVVALDAKGRLAAGTSTGGRGFERIGRVSDSAMPAGNYATAQAAVSCTGIGEHIIDECLAARICVRVTDGMALERAFRRSFDEAASRGRDFGAIGIGADGTVAWGKTSDILLAAYTDGVRRADTLELSLGLVVEVFSGAPPGT